MHHAPRPHLTLAASLFLALGSDAFAQSHLFSSQRISATPQSVIHNVPPPVIDAAPVIDPGRAMPAPVQAAPIPKAKPKPAPVVHERVVARNDKRPSFHPESAHHLAAAIEKYRAIAAGGDWPLLPAGTLLKTGSEGEAVIQLRQRLAAEGDLPPGDVTNPVFDAPLAAAVKKFQGRHGQSQNGLVQGATLTALRVSARERVTQLTESAKRLSGYRFAFGPRYVVVNIPSASVEAIDNDQVVRRYIAVVGKKDRASPEVETRITNVNLNPTWTVPVSIIKKDIIPKMQKDPAYLQKAKIRIFGASGGEVDPHQIDWSTERATAFTLRQDSGTSNALGQLRIDMPNREAVYMHDTPSKRLFSSDDRFHSSGCVRVENVRDLAAWVLEGAGAWDRKAIDEAIKDGKRKDVRPAQPVPVIWTYLTGYVTPDGAVHFRPDVYGRDSGETTRVASETPPTPRKRKVAMEERLDAEGLNARANEALNYPVQRIDP